ncbi:1-acyl-sn-glycerol-3-phosphate acyltransferase [Thalassotalea sediminis]|uniref:1-acyl-sn-glycerol-3-phosphate acyltransferase n=1 Tax=Thalassotalea sediminis TaxID=1759089 RepID=UPI002572A1C7|nr:1-acyl-sn-glycerol-3-phosphate acyltransferase [Thalassotalea sediminis]
MKRFVQYLFLLKVKYLAKILFRFNIRQNVNAQPHDWRQVNLIIFLNHTSLFEPLLLGVAPNILLKQIAARLMIPAADTTLARPFTGKLLKAVIPGCIPITRKKDASWQVFLDQVASNKLVAILPEGRMKRRNGLDKHGEPMSIKPGVVDILERLSSGKILFVYSGGLHHIQAPGDKLPKLFKEIDVGLELVDIKAYKAGLLTCDSTSFKDSVVNDLQRRLSTCE